MHQTKVTQINCTTGEVMEGVNVFIPRRPKLREDFMLLDLRAIEKLGMDKDITINDFRVLTVLFGRLEYENWLYITQQEIADQLGLQRPNVTKCLKKLIDKGIILKGSKLGKVNGYRLNAYYGWRGRITKEYQSTYEKHSKLIQFPQLPSSS
jgi:predicted transcriptional regulator